MPDTVYLESQGVQLKRGDGASPEVFTLVPQAISIGGPDGSSSEIDVTTLDSLAKEIAMGLKDEGSISLEFIHNPSHAQHLGLRTDRGSGSTKPTKRNFQLVMTDSPATTWSFAAYVQQFSIGNAVDDVQRLSVTLRVTGEVTES